MSTAAAAAPAATFALVSPFGDPALLPHDSKKADIIASGVITLFLAGCFVAARFYTRMFITRTRIGASEWLVLLAWIFSFGVTIPQILETGYGMGAHVYDMAIGDINSSDSAKAGLISILFYSLSLTFSKLSMLALYLVVFPYNWVRSVSFILLAVVAVGQTWVLYVIFSACTPLEAFWDPTILGATCHPQVFWLSNQYLMIATDFMIFLLPLPVVWRLKVRPGHKVLLVFVFAMGFFVCAISVIRITLIIPLTNNPGPDFTYSGIATYYWTDVETNLAIVVASSINLKPFVSCLLPKSWLSSPDGDLAHNNINNNGHRYPMHTSLVDPIATIGSRFSRLTGRAGPGEGAGAASHNIHGGHNDPIVADDTKVLNIATSSHASHNSSSYLDNDSQSTSNSHTIDEELGLPQHEAGSELKSHLQHAVHSVPSDQTLGHDRR
ncbi:uncharacterized protein SPSK_06256 [Sporothrix schenckii 1099-18]|uniref:Rhodopsin domain-containing protein n=1 Tax=Sporothrix schenckii 1099-18 TaxID=1397361 RepID=A0A0F2MJ36_SPOSC|nr:uncharacterized protein SPSK_06256 [Sporothrix schenckii 1099-18]KJR89713.1 hypothetical protein SPSK_06256 [Sporothrix schenckii 1099-18]